MAQIAPPGHHYAAPAPRAPVRPFYAANAPPPPPRSKQNWSEEESWSHHRQSWQQHHGASQGASSQEPRKPRQQEVAEAAEVLELFFDGITQLTRRRVIDAWNKRSKETHPDKNPSQKDAAEFRAVQAAKRMLLDEVARSAGESRDS